MIRSIDIEAWLRGIRFVVCTCFDLRATWTVNIIGSISDSWSSGTARAHNGGVNIRLTRAVGVEGLTHRSSRAFEGNIVFGAARSVKAWNCESLNIRAAWLVNTVLEIWAYRL